MVEVRKQSWINIDGIQVTYRELDSLSLDMMWERKENIPKFDTTFRYEEVRDKAVVGGLQYCDL